MNKKTTLPLNYDLIKRDYEMDYNDDDRLRTVKEAMERLTPAEKKIWLTYVEYGTYSDTAREYNVSSPTAKSYVVKVREKIINEIEKNSK